MSTMTSFDTTSTKSADPWTDAGYSQWLDQALTLRRQWMGMMGLGDEEINLACQPGSHADLEEELAQYNAMLQIQQINQKKSRS